MTALRYCPKCKIYRKINIQDFLRTLKKRVVCGICGSPLMTKEEAYSILYYQDA